MFVKMNTGVVYKNFYEKNEFKTVMMQRFREIKCLIPKLRARKKIQDNSLFRMLACRKENQLKIPIKPAINIVSLSLSFAKGRY
jgi:hypothetical protein